MPRMGEKPGADPRYLHNSPEEKAGRQTRGGAGGPTESHFSQIRPGGGGSTVAAAKAGRARNGRYGRNLRG